MTMFGAICFALLIPLAVRRHQLALAGVVLGLFVVYIIINAIAWRRNFRR
jgi:amino acid transporter